MPSFPATCSIGSIFAARAISISLSTFLAIADVLPVIVADRP
jgi:hypothetical protein